MLWNSPTSTLGRNTKQCGTAAQAGQGLEARLLCRDAISTAPNEAAAGALRGNLGALLLSSGDAVEALKLLEEDVQPSLDGPEFAGMVSLWMYSHMYH